MNSSILDAVRENLTPETVQQIGGSLGLDASTTSKAISMALPVLLGGMTTNAASPQGAASLDTALDNHDGSILDNLGGLIRNPAGAAGAAILGHILGRRQAPVEDGVAKASGISAAQVSQLLIMLAPIVMGVLGRMKQKQGLNAEKLPEVLQKNTAAAEEENPIISGLNDLLRGGDKSGGGGIADAIGSIAGGFFGNKN